ncbi:ATP synthase subunit I [Virgibacillus sp. NKC19-3]|uniref:ATP synthase subunit I n=1 Tax=Virgibacillus saliphilus TaxID=2831674 RepID=UPI001C9AF3CE|nr:ATP synthase subunit I [Virgibacillus sp. NKC19-3]MBY7144727.1 ATP synthase subunit I [Virgibacillus sp. NKC19-3]
MSDYNVMIARQRKWMLYLLAILLIGAIFLPYPRVLLGLLLGTMASFYNLWMLQKKIVDFTEAVANQSSTRGIGMVSRFAAAILAVIVALRFEEYFHIIAVLIGLMTSYVVIMIDVMVFRKKD